jgi:hexosaminidase
MQKIFPNKISGSPAKTFHQADAGPSVTYCHSGGKDRPLFFFPKLVAALFSVCLLLAMSLPLAAQQAAEGIALIPEPVSLQRGTGTFVLSSATSIQLPGKPEKDPARLKIAQYLRDEIRPATGLDLKISREASSAGIQLLLNNKPDAQLGAEGYQLEVSPEKVLIRANHTSGLFYGVQSLLQLLPKEIESKALISHVKWEIPAVSVIDYPRFAWRGAMLDVSRHFFNKEEVKDFIDQIARYKFNRFHWHLTDDNGWRIEIKSLPRLTEVGAWRVERHGQFGSRRDPEAGEPATYGGFYTQEDIREVVQYAKERYIEILPEIDVPGHSMAALAAYPELSVSRDPHIMVNPGTKFATWHGNHQFTMHIDNILNPTDEKVYQFLDKVFGEVATLFPFDYIHMGGDEAYHGYWERDTDVQAFMKKNKIKDSKELQSYFVKRVNKIIRSKGKKMIGWDEIMDGGLAQGAAVMSWRGTKGGIEASKLKAPVVMSPAPMAYLDLYQGDPSSEPPTYSMARLRDSYSWDPLADGVDSTYVLGGQGNIWTEHIPNTAQIQYMAYPRAFALAELYWSPRHKKDWNRFVPKVEQHFARFDQAGMNYARSMYDPIIKVSKNEAGQLVLDLSTEVEGLELFYTIDKTIPNQYYARYSKPIVLPEDVELFRVVSYRAGKPMGKLISISSEDLAKRAGR